MSSHTAQKLNGPAKRIKLETTIHLANSETQVIREALRTKVILGTTSYVLSLLTLLEAVDELILGFDLLALMRTTIWCGDCSTEIKEILVGDPPPRCTRTTTGLSEEQQIDNFLKQE